MWDCPTCETRGILGLPHCPVCGTSRPKDSVSTTVLPAEDVPAAPAVAGPSASLAGEDKEAAAAIEPGSQAPKSSKKS